MLNQKSHFIVFIVVFWLKLSHADDSRKLELEDTITFTIIQKNGSRVVSTFDDDDIGSKGCSKEENWAIIVHGWLEGIDVFWMNDTIGNLTKYRGGCLMVMDYSTYSKRDYFTLLFRFFPIKDVLVKKLNQFRNEGFDFDKGYLFGFSFGASKLISKEGIF
jgi:hypothetical protein